jgi:hypothetical protein
MAFAIKNIFQKGASPDPSQADDRQAPGSSPFSAAHTPPSPSAFNPGFGGALFKTLGSEPLDSAPVSVRPGGSPFAQHSAADSTVLTVADLLPVLPPELARVNGAMPDQPVALAPHVLETAISSGQLAVPIFEVYRVCPALFQTPVSPHDPRMVSLPRGKLPNLIASHTGALKPPQAEASPFSHVPQSGGSPFAPALPEVPPAGMMTQGMRPAGALPPRRPPGTPPAIPTQADFIGGNQASGGLSLPNYDQPQPASSFQASPFSAMQSPSSSPVPGQTSLLFSSPQPPSDPELAALPEAPSPFAATAYPFAPAQPMAPPPASPFSFPMPASPQAPSGTSPFAAAVAPFEVAPQPPAPELPKLGQLPFAAPQSPPPMPGASPFGASQPMGPPTTQVSRPMEAAGAHSNEMLQVSLAAVLRGHGAQDLGFDPNFIPAWINTKLPASMVQPQLASGQVSLDLGTIIDGTEPTFRSVIAHGRRGYTVRMPASDVFQTGGAPATSEPSPFAMPTAQQPSPFAPAPSMVSPLPGLVQPLASVSRPFNPPPAPEPQPLPPAKPEGMGSEQLFGEHPFAAAPPRPMFSPVTSGVQPLPEILSPAMPGNPILEQAAMPFSPTRDSNRAPSAPLFKTSSPAPATEFKPAQPSVSGGAVMGLSGAGDSEQMLLRALLGHTGKLDAAQVVKRTSQLPGIIACVNVRHGQVHGEAEASKAAQDFRDQAADISRSMRTLAGVIGIDAETLSIAAGERTITFCFQPDNAFGVLHQDNEPASGLREKITLIGREVAKLPA